MNTNCPKCGSKVVYEGLNKIECSSYLCENFCGPKIKKSNIAIFVPYIPLQITDVKYEV